MLEIAQEDVQIIESSDLRESGISEPIISRKSISVQELIKTDSPMIHDYNETLPVED